MARALTDKYGDRVKWSRLDVAIDDHEKTITPARFAQHCLGVEDIVANDLAPLAAGVVTSIRRQRAVKYTTGRRTCILGVSGSLRFLRVYDKDLESDGAIKATRMELQLRNENAQEAMARILASDNVARAMVEELSRYVDFREVSGDGDRRHSSRWKRCSWWEKLVGSERVKRIRREPAEVVRDGRRLLENIKRGIRARCRTLVEVFGGDLKLAMRALVMDGTGELIPVRVEDRYQVEVLRGGSGVCSGTVQHQPLVPARID